MTSCFLNSARADAGTKARLKAQCERANRELTREKEALGRTAKRLGEMQGAQGEASSIRQLAEAEAESVKAKYAELALKVSGAQKATADATLLASTATAELELAVRAKDAAVEESARLRSRVDTYEQTVSELREEIRGFSTADVAQELKTAMAKQSEAHEAALCELRNKAAAAEAQTGVQWPEACVRPAKAAPMRTTRQRRQQSASFTFTRLWPAERQVWEGNRGTDSAQDFVERERLLSPLHDLIIVAART